MMIHLAALSLSLDHGSEKHRLMALLWTFYSRLPLMKKGPNLLLKLWRKVVWIKSWGVCVPFGNIEAQAVKVWLSTWPFPWQAANSLLALCICRLTRTSVRYSSMIVSESRVISLLTGAATWSHLAVVSSSSVSLRYKICWPLGI